MMRFFTLGMRDADQRVAARLAAPPLGDTDRYLQDSSIVRAIDRGMMRLSVWWSNAASRQRLADAREEFAGRDIAAQYRAIGTVVLTAVIVHIVMTLVQGPRPGFFWLVIPGLALAFAVPLLLASNGSSRSN